MRPDAGATEPGPVTRGKVSRRGLRADDAILGMLAGLGLTYFVLTPHAFPHPLHWLAAGLAGAAGGLGVWLYVVRPWERLLRRPPPPAAPRLPRRKG